MNSDPWRQSVRSRMGLGDHRHMHVVLFPGQTFSQERRDLFRAAAAQMRNQ